MPDYRQSYVLTPKDVDAILEASRPCPLPSTAAATSGTTAVQLPTKATRLYWHVYQGKRLKESQRKKKLPYGKVILMACRPDVLSAPTISGCSEARSLRS